MSTPITGAERDRIVAIVNRSITTDNEEDAKWFAEHPETPRGDGDEEPLLVADQCTVIAHPVLKDTYAVSLPVDSDGFVPAYVVEGESARDVGDMFDDKHREFPPGAVLKPDTDEILYFGYASEDLLDEGDRCRFYCFSHDSEIPDGTPEYPAIEHTRAFHRTDFKAGDAVYPIYFHANDRGGWSVKSADGKIDEYWQEGR
jgi:hypothetical protein